MAIKKKDMDKEAERKRFIAKGGSAKGSSTEWSTICIRIPKNMLIDIDIEKDKRIGSSRNAWILHVLQEKLEQTQEK